MEAALRNLRRLHEEATDSLIQPFLPSVSPSTEFIPFSPLPLLSVLSAAAQSIISWLEKFYFKHQRGLKFMGRDVPNLGTPLQGCPKPWDILLE